MKTQLLFYVLLYCSLSFNANSQPSLLSTEMLPFGSVMYLKPALDLSVIDTTVQGANATWDFSGLQVDPAGSDLYVQIADPAQTPYGSSFPTANYAYIESPTTAYRYFDFQCKEAVTIEYTVESALGETIFSGQSPVTPQFPLELDMDFSRFASGMYFLTIKPDQPGREVKSIKLIKL